jgi:hypothetical protein
LIGSAAGAAPAPRAASAPIDIACMKRKMRDLAMGLM